MVEKATLRQAAVVSLSNHQGTALGGEMMRRAAELLAQSTPCQMSQAVQEVVKKNEDWRGRQCINLLAPEALISPTARKLLSSELCQRAGEGEIGDRWFAGTRYIDELEALCVELAKKLFHCQYADQRLVAGMVCNTPDDTPADWDTPGGIRLGTIEVTRLGMKEAEMVQIADFIHRVLVEKETVSKVARDIVDFRQGFQKVHYCFD